MLLQANKTMGDQQQLLEAKVSRISQEVQNPKSSNVLAQVGNKAESKQKDK